MVSAPAPWQQDWDDLSCLLLTDAWAYHAQHAGRADRYRPAIAEFVEASQHFTNASAYLAAQQRRAAGAAAWEDWFVGARHRPRAGADAADRPLRPGAGL